MFEKEGSRDRKSPLYIHFGLVPKDRGRFLQIIVYTCI